MNPINESDGNGSIIDAKKMGAVWGVVIPLLLIAVTVYSICIREQANSTDMNGTLSMIFKKLYKLPIVGPVAMPAANVLLLLLSQ